MPLTILEHDAHPLDRVLRSDSVGRKETLCLSCRGARMLCGKSRCPVLVRFSAARDLAPLTSGTELYGFSPPAVFIGRFGYPKVYVGPLVPPRVGDTLVFDTPEWWSGFSIDAIVRLRFELVRGMARVDVRDPRGGGRLIDQLQELALAQASAETEARFRKAPRGRLTVDDDVQPFGPSAPLEHLWVGNVRADHRLERVHSDTDLPARDGVSTLYEHGAMVSQIQRAFSAGLLGVERQRRLVPTRWSITAVDSMLGEHLLEQTREFPILEEARLYESRGLDNRWVVLLFPTAWMYELIEAWYPNTAWNPAGRHILMFSDSEFFEGRSTYAEIGGCYYAARLAVNELLHRERRQAGVCILREAHPGYILPVGVWNVRERVREALSSQPRCFEDVWTALASAAAILDIPMERWLAQSTVLQNVLYQRRLEQFLGPAPATRYGYIEAQS